MSQEIRLRRGTQAQLNTITLASGELGFTTDQHQVFVGDGSNNHLVGRVIIDTLAARPAAGISGRVFMASDTRQHFVDNGTSWVEAAPSVIDDAITSTEKTWSSKKIQDMIAASGTAAEFQDSVLTRTATPPVSPNEGDRYLVIATAGGVFASHENEIATYEDGSWSYHTPTTGTYLGVDNETDCLYYFGGASWTKRTFETNTPGDGIDIDGSGVVSVDASDIIGHGLEDDGSNNIRIAAAAAGNGLTGGAGNPLSVQQETGKGISVGSNGISISLDTVLRNGAGSNDVNNNPIYRDSNGINVKIDNESIKLDGTAGNRLTVGIIDAGTFV